MTATIEKKPIDSTLRDLARRAAEAGDKGLLAEVGQVAASGSEADVERLAGLESHFANDALKRVCEAMKLDFEAVTERAAVMEIDGNMPRLTAEKAAVAEAIQVRTGWTPPAAFLKALFRRGLVNSQARLKNPNPAPFMQPERDADKAEWLKLLYDLCERERRDGPAPDHEWTCLLVRKPAHVDLEKELHRVRNEKV